MRVRAGWARAVGLLLVATAAGCASSGTGTSDTFRSDMGRILAGPLADARLKVWSKYSIPLFREETSFRSVLYESEWMPREATPAEAAAGVLEARNRVMIRGRRVEGEMDMATGVYRVTFEVDNQVATETNPEWHPAPIPDQVVRDYRRVLSDLELEVRSGVRR